jgi:hypothetical protein
MLSLEAHTPIPSRRSQLENVLWEMEHIMHYILYSVQTPIKRKGEKDGCSVKAVLKFDTSAPARRKLV